MIGTVVERLLHLHGAAALTLVFLLPALEASAFLGFLFPGEIAVILGGVLASQGRFPLVAAIAAAVIGAFVGDSVGYAIGRKYGRRLLHGTLGRIPRVKRRLESELVKAEAFLLRRGPWAVMRLVQAWERAAFRARCATSPSPRSARRCASRPLSGPGGRDTTGQ